MFMTTGAGSMQSTVGAVAEYAAGAGNTNHTAGAGVMYLTSDGQQRCTWSIVLRIQQKKDNW